MKRGFGRSRAGSFLWRLRGAESSGEGDSNSLDDAPPQPHSARAAVWQSQPEFRSRDLPKPRGKPELKRRGSLGAWLLRLRVSRDKSDEEERKYTAPTTSDEDDHSYAEDDNRDSGRVNSRTQRKRKRTGGRRTRARRVSADDFESADEMAPSTSRARGSRGGRAEDKEEDGEETTSLSSSEDSTEECVAVDSDEDSDDSSGSSETSSASEDEEDANKRRRRERAQERRQREKRKAEEKKRLRKVEKRKLQKLANQRKREGLGELQKQLQKRREEKEVRRQEEKHWKELRRIEKFLDKARQKEEKKARKMQLQEQRQREARARQEQLRHILLARLGQLPSDEAGPATVVRQEQLRAVGHEAAAPSGTEQTADEAVGTAGHERGTATRTTAERKAQVEAAPSIIGLPSTVKGSRPAKEVVTIAVTEPCRPPSRGDETEEAEDEESDDTNGKRSTSNRGRVTDIPALRLGACAPKRSPKTQVSSAQLIRGLIGFDQLSDALFELNREVEELRNLTS